VNFACSSIWIVSCTKHQMSELRNKLQLIVHLKMYSAYLFTKNYYATTSIGRRHLKWWAVFVCLSICLSCALTKGQDHQVDWCCHRNAPFAGWGHYNFLKIGLLKVDCICSRYQNWRHLTMTVRPYLHFCFAHACLVYYLYFAIK